MDGSASARDWTYHEAIARTGPTTRASTPCWLQRWLLPDLGLLESQRRLPTCNRWPAWSQAIASSSYAAQWHTRSCFYPQERLYCGTQRNTIQLFSVQA